MAEAFEVESRAGAEGSSERRVARGQAEDVGRELHSLVTEVYNKTPDVEQTLASPAVKRSAKAPVLEHAFKNNVSDLVFNLLNVLNAKDRLTLVRHVAAAYTGLMDDRAKRVRVSVRS